MSELTQLFGFQFQLVIWCEMVSGQVLKLSFLFSRDNFLSYFFLFIKS